MKSIFLNSLFFKQWLVGLTDGDGTFTIIRKKNRPCSWYFSYKISLFTPNIQLLYFIKKMLKVGIVQKYDSHILLAISKIFHIKAKMLLNKKDNCYSINTTNSRSIKNIIKYFEGPHKNKSFLKGIKSLEFKIWARTYRKYKGNYIKLIEIQKFLRRLRTKIYLLKV
uniref:Putative LAGLIDADG homing endonuclease n=1 Tax=Helicosporidium sp. subsp. Simulium jonesii TaxID=145475 RepID=D3IZX0_HELSJ|nr:putative LAGLIDADG homing endonuclease [Helicosporidium sp. ex Simulium jonesi]ACT36197.1 putative LAGLIDADG homing endonuclease [Helicosporidium sp. ex Simulium jonesi]